MKKKQFHYVIENSLNHFHFSSMNAIISIQLSLERFHKKPMISTLHFVVAINTEMFYVIQEIIFVNIWSYFVIFFIVFSFRKSAAYSWTFVMLSSQNGHKYKWISSLGLQIKCILSMWVKWIRYVTRVK